VPGLDKRAIQGIDSGQHGLGLIPRKDFAISHVFEGKTVDGKTRLLVGTPQATSGNHAQIVEVLGRRNYDGPDAEYTVYHRSLKTSTGRTNLGSQADKRPDIAVVNRNGTVDLYEVQSGEQLLQDLADHITAMKAALPSINQGKLFVYDKFGQPFTFVGGSLGDPVILP
jgi:hypothetical protein